MTNHPLFLVADIGGTNTRVGLADHSGLQLDSTRRYRNAEYDGFQAVLERYLAEMTPGALAGACVGVAGLVTDGAVRMTNLDWAIDRATVQAVTGAPLVDVINDLQAQGFALDDLPDSSLQQVIRGVAKPFGPRLVIGLGTGFNIVPVNQEQDRLLVPGCEAGHMSAPFSAKHAELFCAIEALCGRVTVESLLAGQGLENIYQAQTGQRKAAGAIMQAVAESDAAALQVFADYLDILAQVTGDLAIEHLPYAGIYFTGGVSRAVTPYFEAQGFAQAMQQSQPLFPSMMADFPITLIEDDFAALKGCARYLRQIS